MWIIGVVILVAGIAALIIANRLKAKPKKHQHAWNRIRFRQCIYGKPPDDLVVFISVEECECGKKRALMHKLLSTVEIDCDHAIGILDGDDTGRKVVAKKGK